MSNEDARICAKGRIHYVTHQFRHSYKAVQCPLRSAFVPGVLYVATLSFGLDEEEEYIITSTALCKDFYHCTLQSLLSCG